MVAHRGIRRVRLCNEEGLHLRAAALLSQEAKKFPCVILISSGALRANGKSVWELIDLIAEPGTELIIEAEGSQSEEALDHLEKIVTRQFQVLSLENCDEKF